MRESGERRDTVPAGRDTFAVGDQVRGALDDYPGTVVSLEPLTVQWRDGRFPVVIPESIEYMIRKAWPWE